MVNVNLVAGCPQSAIQKLTKKEGEDLKAQDQRSECIYFYGAKCNYYLHYYYLFYNAVINMAILCPKPK